MDTLNQLEYEVLTRLLASSSVDFDCLRAQLPQIQVQKRTFTGVGFYTDLVVAQGVEGIPGCAKGTVGALDADCEEVRSGVGFLLFLKDGRLSQLECFTYAGEPLGSVALADYQFEPGTVEIRCGSVTR